MEGIKIIHKLIAALLPIVVTCFLTAFFTNYYNVKDTDKISTNKKVDIHLETIIDKCDCKSNLYLDAMKQELFYFDLAYCPAKTLKNNTKEAKKSYNICISDANESIEKYELITGRKFAERMHQCLGFINMKLTNHEQSLNKYSSHSNLKSIKHEREYRDEIIPIASKYVRDCLSDRATLESYIQSTGGELPGVIIQ
ncbi:TPA: hypothetical protein SJ142_004603 [Yersinia enterocolitica]|nr:hypothetical protein [Yersinia enterocolitica]